MREAVLGGHGIDGHGGAERPDREAVAVRLLPHEPALVRAAARERGGGHVDVTRQRNRDTGKHRPPETSRPGDGFLNARGQGLWVGNKGHGAVTGFHAPPRDPLHDRGQHSRPCPNFPSWHAPLAREARKFGWPSLAKRQWGVVTRAQLEECGLEDAGISRWIHERRLHRIYPGVYAVGHLALGIEGRLAAALFYAGPGAALCGVTAG